MDTIQLQLELAEVNKILKSLGALPYSEVYQLIEKIQHQAALQIEDNGQTTASSPDRHPGAAK